ncbi:MAG: tautomerase family protein, partial [Burkholderiales bacterium]
MPLVRISLMKGKPASHRRKVGDAVHQAMVETINVPPKDRFQIITEHDPEDFVFDREFLGIERSHDLVIIQITLAAGRSLALKRALY